MRRSSWSWQAALAAASLLLVGAACRSHDTTSRTSGALGGADYGDLPDAGTDADDTSPDAGAGSGSDSGAGPDLDAGTGSGSDSGTGPDLDAGTGSGSDDGGGGPDLDAGTGSGSDGGGGGSGSDGGTCGEAGSCDDICVQLDRGMISRSDVSQETLDECDGIPPSSSCLFSPVPSFFLGDEGCNIIDPSMGDLGNYSGVCPTDPYEQRDLCDYARSARGPEPLQIDRQPWIQGPGGDEPADGQFPHGFDYPNPFDDGIDPMTGMPAYVGSVTIAAYWRPGDLLPNDFFTFLAQGPRPMSQTDYFRQNQFETRPAPSGNARNVVVLGSSMMSTHNQVRNGRMCSRASTRADRRGLIGNDFEASPAWSTRVPWRLALALGRTGFDSGNVNAAAVGTPDSCNNPWLSAAPPAQTGINWLNVVGKTNAIMVTDGGLINDQKSTTGSWTDTLAGLVVCNALERLRGAAQAAVTAEHTALNPAGVVIVRGRIRLARAPTVTFVRSVPRGVWAGALDLPGNVAQPRCGFAVAGGNGIAPRVTPPILRAIGKNVPPLVRLWPGVPPANPVPGNLTAIKNLYVAPAVDVKQIWLQYPYMDQANVSLRGRDFALFFAPGPARWLVNAWGAALITIPAIDLGLRPRIRQVTNDLNNLMYNAIGCGGLAFAAGHAARVCARNPAGAPRVVVTRDNYVGWAAADHQDTIVGGMPHESAAGANKLGAAIVAADGLP